MMSALVCWAPLASGCLGSTLSLKRVRVKSQGIGSCHMNTSVKIPLGSYEYQIFISACMLTFKCFDVIFIGREVEGGMLGTENQPQSWWV